MAMTFEEICAAMEDPATYADPVSSVERRDTHISAVFLAGDWVYKLKKPVDMGFLDFSDLESRRVFCFREVELNRRLTNGVYMGVTSVVRRNEEENEKIALVEEEESQPEQVLEYAVKMRRLPDDRSLTYLLEANGIETSQIANLGEKLARFYNNAERGPEINKLGDLSRIRKNVYENFVQTKEFVGDLLKTDLWTVIRDASYSFLEQNRGLFSKRIDENRICNGHGDLRSDHIYFAEEIQIIDCIEFNDRFRYLDPASDLGFLHTDLIHRGGWETSLEIVEAVTEKTDDLELYRLLDFYACYRAMVRTKVSCLRFSQIDNGSQKQLRKEIEGHLHLAFQNALGFARPVLWVVCGLPATGKTTLAQSLSEFLNLPLFQSDSVRIQLASRLSDEPKVTSFGKGLFRAAAKKQVYARMLLEAQGYLEKGESVILDATYSNRNQRQEVLRLASNQESSCIFLETTCGKDTMRARLKERGKKKMETQARAGHLGGFLKAYQPLDEAPSSMVLKVDTEVPPDKSFKKVIRDSYRLHHRQVRSYIDARLS